MPFFPEERFQRDSCTGCGACSRVCPSLAVRTDGNGRVVGFRKACIRCGHCGAYCPENAFGLPPVPRGCSPESLDALCRSRRSARLFLNAPLNDGELERLLAPVAWSPTGTNSQGVTVVVLEGAEKVQATVVRPLRRFLAPLMPLASLTGMGDHVRAFRRGADPVTRNAPYLLLFCVPRKNSTQVEDGVIAATLVMLQAEAMGLGCLWNGVVRILCPLLPGLRRWIPRGTRARAVLCVGKRALDPLWEVPDRNWTTITR